MKKIVYACRQALACLILAPIISHASLNDVIDDDRSSKYRSNTNLVRVVTSAAVISSYLLSVAAADAKDEESASYTAKQLLGYVIGGGAAAIIVADPIVQLTRKIGSSIWYSEWLFNACFALQHGNKNPLRIKQYFGYEINSLLKSRIDECIDADLSLLVYNLLHVLNENYSQSKRGLEQLNVDVSYYCNGFSVFIRQYENLNLETLEQITDYSTNVIEEILTKFSDAKVTNLFQKMYTKLNQRHNNPGDFVFYRFKDRLSLIILVKNIFLLGLAQ